jgi:hypothetical protein
MVRTQLLLLLLSVNTVTTVVVVAPTAAMPLAPRSPERARSGERAEEQIAAIAKEVVDEEEAEPDGRLRIPPPHARTPAFGTVKFKHLEPVPLPEEKIFRLGEGRRQPV